MRELENRERSGESVGAISVSSVSLDGFRNYRRLDLDLSSRFNVLSGRNGQGKTNFLEALYLLATTRLLRGQRDIEAILEGMDRAVVTAELDPSATRISVIIEKGARKKALLNNLGLPRASDLLGRLPCVSVSSADMEIVRGEPSERRLFLDLELSSLFPSYLRHLSHYKRALEQRNALLKDSREFQRPAAMFEPWEEQLAEHGVAMRESRQDFVTRLAPRMSRLHAQMGGGEHVGALYVARDEATDRATMLEMLASSRQQEIARGSTIIGPHRDDVQIDISERDGRLYGSQGQQRTAVIALKLATLEVSRQELGIPPLLLLDDIFSDLDESRRALLVDVVLENAGQVVLTCTEASAAGPRILDQAKLFSVNAGEVTES
ncbi:MAG: DNA replication/repair protein RecF [Fimbriimonas sp.]